MFQPTMVTACCTNIIIGVRLYGRFQGRVGVSVRGHKGTLVFLGYGTHGQ